MSKYRVVITAKILAHQWWGQKWCQNIENYADFSNRLERGRTYIRSGKVHDISIDPGNVTTISAKVDGTREDPYDVKIVINPLHEKTAKEILKKIVNLNLFKEGIVPDDYKFLFSIENGGIFPTKDEINVYCSCPDEAVLCKHVAAVLYAIGSILDKEPLLLFQLRGIDVDSYLDSEIREKTNDLLVYAKNFNDKDRLIEDDLVAEIFGIAIGELHTEDRRIEDISVQASDKENVRTILIESSSRAYHRKTTPQKTKKPVNYIQPVKKVICQYELDGKFIAQYDTYDEASEKTGVPKRNIQRNVCGEKKSGGGYVWKKISVNECNTSSDPLLNTQYSKKKHIRQYEYNGIMVAEYETISEASCKANINIREIKNALNGLQKQAGGYFWVYEEQ